MAQSAEPGDLLMSSLLEARRLVATALGRPLEAVEATASVGQMAGWDSMGHISIVLALEAQIGRMLRPDEIGRLKSIDDVAAILSTSA
jgi:acyl carrier protein